MNHILHSETPRTRRTRSSVQTDRACMNLKKNLTGKSKRKTFPRAWNTASWSVKSNFLKRRWKITSLSFWFAQDFRDWTVLVMYIPITPINSICSTFDFATVFFFLFFSESKINFKRHIMEMRSLSTQKLPCKLQLVLLRSFKNGGYVKVYAQ